MAGRSIDLTLYLVTDTLLCGDVGVSATVEAAVAAGVTAVQVRDPRISDDEFVRLGRSGRLSWPVPVCRSSSTTGCTWWRRSAPTALTSGRVTSTR